jgi:hypothetical protein
MPRRLSNCVKLPYRRDSLFIGPKAPRLIRRGKINGDSFGWSRVSDPTLRKVREGWGTRRVVDRTTNSYGKGKMRGFFPFAQMKTRTTADSSPSAKLRVRNDNQKDVLLLGFGDGLLGPGEVGVG